MAGGVESQIGSMAVVSILLVEVNSTQGNVGSLILAAPLKMAWSAVIIACSRGAFDALKAVGFVVKWPLLHHSERRLEMIKAINGHNVLVPGTEGSRLTHHGKVLTECSAPQWAICRGAHAKEVYRRATWKQQHLPQKHFKSGQGFAGGVLCDVQSFGARVELKEPLVSCQNILHYNGVNRRENGVKMGLIGVKVGLKWHHVIPHLREQAPRVRPRGFRANPGVARLQFHPDHFEHRAQNAA